MTKATSDFRTASKFLSISLSEIAVCLDSKAVSQESFNGSLHSKNDDFVVPVKLGRGLEVLKLYLNDLLLFSKAIEIPWVVFLN